MKLIGLTGPAGAGKDTLAGMILDHVSGHSVAFADPLRHAAAAMFGLTMDQMLDRDLKEKVIPRWGKSPREILQLLGTEGARDLFGNDVWCKRAQITLDQIVALDKREHTAADVCIFTDVRFKDEAQWINERGGVVIEIRRKAAIPVGIAGHRSAAPLPAHIPDWTIYNDKSLSDLRELVSRNLNDWLEDATHLHELARNVLWVA